MAALNRTDADVSIFFLAPNSVKYESPVTDPFFVATNELSVPNADGEGPNLTYYFSDHYVNVLACVGQHQYCNPTNDDCTPLTGISFLPNEIQKLKLNPDQGATAVRNFPGLFVHLLFYF